MRLSTVKHSAGLKLASRDQLNHLNIKKTKQKKQNSFITHVAVIKSLNPRFVSTGCLLHLSLIWLLALIWGNRSLTGIQSSLCTRSVSSAAAASQRLPCVGNLGRKRSPTKSACEQTPLLAVRSAFPLLRRFILCLPPSLSLSPLNVIKCNDLSLQWGTPLVFADDFHPSVSLVSRGLAH